MSSEASTVGSHRDQKSSSLSGIISTLIPVFIFAAVALTIFLILRKRLPAVYRPRTYIGTLASWERTPGGPKENNGMFAWIKTYRALPDTYLLNRNSLDAYLFIRFLKMIVIICAGGCVILWPILFPVNITGGGRQQQLNKLSFSNVENPARYYAHAIMAWVFTAFVAFIITRETIYFINLRQAYFLSPRHESRVSSRTVLFTSVPEAYRNEASLRRILRGVKRVWIARDFPQLDELLNDRDMTATKLETALVQLSRTATIKGSVSNPHDVTRPTHRTKPLIGDQVDTISWSDSHLKQLLPASHMREKRSEHDSTNGAVFVEFQSQSAAQGAFQKTIHHEPLMFTSSAIGMLPREVVWKNLGISEWSRTIRKLVAGALVAVLILFFTVPVSFIGALSNINYLTSELPWLSFITNVPDRLLGIITGFLPALLLAILIAIVPKLLRKLAQLTGETTLTQIELTTQSWFFGFQVVQVFLVTTFTSGAAAVASQISQNPTQVPQLLARNLPLASNFYLSYFIIYGLAVSSLTILNVKRLLKVYIVGSFAKSPRKKYTSYVSLTTPLWGTFYPKFTGLAVIAITYSCIAPLVLGFAAVGLFFLYLALRYNFFYTFTTTINTGGRAYGRALEQLFTGLYLMQICLLGLFIISTSSGSAISSGPVILMLILIVLTVVYHVKMRQALHKLTVTLPEDLMSELDVEKRNAAVMHNGTGTAQNGLHVNAPTTQTVLRPGESVVIHANGGQQDHHEKSTPVGLESQSAPPRVGLFRRFLHPTKYESALAMRRYLRDDIFDTPVSLPVEAYDVAYVSPGNSEPNDAEIWLAKDKNGIASRQAHELDSVRARKVRVVEEAGECL